jgi:hypothetical protein
MDAPGGGAASLTHAGCSPVVSEDFVMGKRILTEPPQSTGPRAMTRFTVSWHDSNWSEIESERVIGADYAEVLEQVGRYLNGMIHSQRAVGLEKGQVVPNCTLTVEAFHVA